MQSKEPKRCGAKTRRGGKCHGWAMPNGRCRMHGGQTPVGIALPQTHDARHSKHIPGRLKDCYEGALRDPEILALREEVALMDARLSDLLSQIDAGESGALWKRLQKAWGALLKARAGGNPEKMKEALFEVESAIEAGASEHDVWREVGACLDQRRRLVESERKRLIETKQMVTAEKAGVLVTALIASVRRHVRDEEALAAISADIAGLVVVDGASTLGGN